LIAGWVWAAPFDVPGGELWGEVHETTVWWLVGLICVRVIAVGWHTWVLHDATLARILPGR
jgi:cytochrome b561